MFALQGAPPVSTTPVANLPPVSMIPAANLPRVSTSPVANCHRCQWHRRQIHRCHLHRWQTMHRSNYQTADNLKWTWIKVYLYANSTTQRWPKEIIKKFQIEDFFISHRCQPSAANISANFRKKSKRPNGKIRGFGETDSWKKPEAKNLVTLSLQGSNTTRSTHNRPRSIHFFKIFKFFLMTQSL